MRVFWKTKKNEENEENEKNEKNEKNENQTKKTKPKRKKRNPNEKKEHMPLSKTGTIATERELDVVHVKQPTIVGKKRLGKTATNPFTTMDATATLSVLNTIHVYS